MHTNPQPFARIGDRIEDTIGNTLIRVTRIEDQAYNLYVQNGTTYISELSANFAGPDAAAAACRRASMIRAALKGGVSIHQLIGDQLHNAQVAVSEAEQVLAAAADRLNARTPEQVAEQINAEWDARQTQHLATHNELVQDVQQIVGDRQGWNEARRVAQQAARRNSLGAYAQGRPNTRPVPTGKQAELSDVQRRALNMRNPAGEIRVQPGVAKPTLEALAARGYGRLVLRGGTHRPYEVVKLVLHPAVIVQLNTQHNAA